MDPTEVDDANVIRAQIAHHGLNVAAGDDARTVALARRWLLSAARLRAATEDVLDPTVGPAIVHSAVDGLSED